MLLRSLRTGQEIKRDLDFESVEDVAFSPDSKLFAAASSFGGAKIWETETLRDTGALSAFLDATFSACFSGNGRRLAIGGSGNLKLWDTESRHEVITLEAEGSMFWPTAFSANDNILGASNWKGVLQFWRAPSWEQIARQEQHQQ